VVDGNARERNRRLHGRRERAARYHALAVRALDLLVRAQHAATLFEHQAQG
jgi:hypothetical protein